MVTHFIGKLFPLFGQVRNYNRDLFRGDLFAGLTVAVMLIPQSMAYAMLAGLPPVTGLYASTIPLLIYALFGTSRQLAVGPVALVSFLVLETLSKSSVGLSTSYIALASQLALLTGIILLILGRIRAGAVVNYISRAVVSGFTSAAALIIAVSQFDQILGIRVSRTSTFFSSLSQILTHLRELQQPALITGILTILFLIVIRRRRPDWPAPLLALIISTACAWYFRLDEYGLVILGSIPRGLPALSFVFPDMETFGILLPAALTIAFVGYIESYAIAQSIAVRKHRDIDPDREMMALGAADIAAGLFSGYPVTGGLSRTAVNDGAGAQTGLAGIITSLCISLILLFLTPWFYYLPRPVLSAIVIVAVARLFDVTELLRLYALKRADGITWLATFIATLIGGVETGIPVGVILSLLLFIRRSAHPHIAELGFCRERNDFLNIRRFPMLKRYPDTILLRVDSSVYFANTGFIRRYIERLIAERPETHLVILDFEGVNDMDAVAVSMMENLIDDYDHRGIDFAFARIKGPVRDILTRAGWDRKYSFSIRFRTIRQILDDLEINTGNGSEQASQ